MSGGGTAGTVGRRRARRPRPALETPRVLHTVRALATVRWAAAAWAVVQVVTYYLALPARHPDVGRRVRRRALHRQHRHLAPVFQGMVREVAAREQRLRREVQQLRIEIDETRAARQVDEITESEYFQRLQAKVDQLRVDTAR